MSCKSCSPFTENVFNSLILKCVCQKKTERQGSPRLKRKLRRKIKNKNKCPKWALNLQKEHLQQHRMLMIGDELERIQLNPFIVQWRKWRARCAEGIKRRAGKRVEWWTAGSVCFPLWCRQKQVSQTSEVWTLAVTSYKNVWFYSENILSESQDCLSPELLLLTPLSQGTLGGED